MRAAGPANRITVNGSPDGAVSPPTTKAAKADMRERRMCDWQANVPKQTDVRSKDSNGQNTREHDRYGNRSLKDDLLKQADMRRISLESDLPKVVRWIDHRRNQGPK